MKLPKDLEPYLQDFDYGNPYFIEDIVRDCATIALAIDSGRGNEKEINRAILRRYGLEPK